MTELNEKDMATSLPAEKLIGDILEVQKEGREEPSEEMKSHNIGDRGCRGDTLDVQREDREQPSEEMKSPNIGEHGPKGDTLEVQREDREPSEEMISSKTGEPTPKLNTLDVEREDQEEQPEEMKLPNIGEHDPKKDTLDVQREDLVQEEVKSSNTGESGPMGDTLVVQKEDQESSEEMKCSNSGESGPKGDTPDVQMKDIEEPSGEMKSSNIGESGHKLDQDDRQDNKEEALEEQKIEDGNGVKKEGQAELLEEKVDEDGEDAMKKDQGGLLEIKSLDITNGSPKLNNDEGQHVLDDKMNDCKKLVSEPQVESNETFGEILGEVEEPEPVLDGTEVPGHEASRSQSTRSLDLDPEARGNAWPEKAVSITNFVKERSVSALRRLIGKKDEEEVTICENNQAPHPTKESATKDVPQKAAEKSSWNPLSYIMLSREVDGEEKAEKEEAIGNLVQPITMKGRVILYTRLGCQNSKELRLFLHQKGLRYVEINIDVYPSRKLELEKISGSAAVPKVFFNEVLIGGLSELKSLNESGMLDEKIDYLIAEAPSFEAPLPPLSGEDDVSSRGAVDELALIVRKMKETIVVRDRFSKLRRFTSCFLGSEAVDFLSQDQYLERGEALEFGRKLASNLFFGHVLDENVFEDGNYLYRFLEDDPIVSQCHNIPRGIIVAKPKPITEIASRLRFLSYAIFESYTSEDGKHVDYRSIHGSEEFARYLRTVEELQRVEMQDMPTEEKLCFFINLYNMMAIHGILVLGFPSGPLERKKLYGDFKYVIGGCTYSLSAIQNGILRGNQRPPYNLMKMFGMKDKRLKVALQLVEPLIHFALVGGHRSGPALRCYSPGDIHKELAEAACNFLRSGGLMLDFNSKVASVSSIFKWYRVDFGKNEVELLKYLSKYLEPADSESLLQLLASNDLKVIYQSYDWAVNC